MDNAHNNECLHGQILGTSMPLGWFYSAEDEMRNVGPHTKSLHIHVPTL